MQLGGLEIDLMSVDFVVVIILFLGFTGIIWLPLASIAMLLLTPKVLVEKYFKAPHFTQAELAVLSVFPGTVLRTCAFIGATFQERLRRNRKLDGFLDLVPTWYVKAGKVYAFCVITMMVSLALLIIGALLYLWLNDRLV